jgi:hypothetical protein
VLALIGNFHAFTADANSARDGSRSILTPATNPLVVLDNSSKVIIVDPFRRLIIRPSLLILKPFSNALPIEKRFIHKPGTYFTS